MSRKNRKHKKRKGEQHTPLELIIVGVCGLLIAIILSSNPRFAESSNSSDIALTNVVQPTVFEKATGLRAIQPNAESGCGRKRETTITKQPPPEDLSGDWSAFLKQAASILGISPVPLRWDCTIDDAAGTAFLGEGYICIKSLMSTEFTKIAIAHELGHFEGWLTNQDASEIRADRNALKVLKGMGDIDAIREFAQAVSWAVGDYAQGAQEAYDYWVSIGSP